MMVAVVMTKRVTGITAEHVVMVGTATVSGLRVATVRREDEGPPRANLEVGPEIWQKPSGILRHKSGSLRPKAAIVTEHRGLACLSHTAAHRVSRASGTAGALEGSGGVALWSCGGCERRAFLEPGFRPFVDREKKKKRPLTFQRLCW